MRRSSGGAVAGTLPAAEAGRLMPCAGISARRAPSRRAGSRRAVSEPRRSRLDGHAVANGGRTVPTRGRRRVSTSGLRRGPAAGPRRRSAFGNYGPADGLRSPRAAASLTTDRLRAPRRQVQSVPSNPARSPNAAASPLLATVGSPAAQRPTVHPVRVNPAREPTSSRTAVVVFVDCRQPTTDCRRAEPHGCPRWTGTNVASSSEHRSLLRAVLAESSRRGGRCSRSHRAL